MVERAWKESETRRQGRISTSSMAAVVSALAVFFFSTAARADEIVIEPDDWADEAVIEAAVVGVALSALGGDTSDGLVYSLEGPGCCLPPTGVRSFGWYGEQYYDEHWGRASSPTLQADFNGFLAEQVSIDHETDGQVNLEAFGVGGASLGSVSSASGLGTLTFSAQGNQIESVQLSIASASDFGTLDHMVIQTPEPGSLGLGAALVTLALMARRRRG